MQDQALEILILTRTAMDAELTVNVLGKVDIRARRAKSADEVCQSILQAGALIVSEEILTEDVLLQLKQALEQQPVWSNIPIILVSSSHDSVMNLNHRLEWISKYLQNFSLLEKPIRLATLITVARSTLASRVKQFEQRKTLEELELSRVAAENASVAKSAFLANISHEIRTPLSVISGYLELLRLGELGDDEVEEYIEIIDRNSRQLAGLINDILDISKIEAGKVEASYEEIDLESFLKDVESLFQSLVKRKGLHLKILRDASLPVTITTDDQKVRQILLNLVSNAAKFTAQGSITISVSLCEVQDKQQVICFDIVDTGVGIAADKHGKLFESFSQADESVTRKYGGTGLGLALSKKLAQIIGGSLNLIRSAPGEGSHFQLKVKVATSNPAKTLSSERQISSGALQGLSILLAEDNSDARKMIAKSMTLLGAQVQAVKNGKIALELALAQKFDFILMDIQMPVMDGITAIKELRAAKVSTPAVALTAHALKEDRATSLAAGFEGHITKPIDKSKLVQLIQSLVR